LVAHPIYSLFPGFLSPAECRAYIGLAEARGLARADTDYPPSYRNNDRLVLDDTAMAGALFARLRPLLRQSLEVKGRDRRRETWRLAGLNERMRFCRYRPGQRFSIHQDGVHNRRRVCPDHHLGTKLQRGPPEFVEHAQRLGSAIARRGLGLGTSGGASALRSVSVSPSSRAISWPGIAGSSVDSG